MAFLKLHGNCQALQLIYHKPLTVIYCFSKVAEIFFSRFCYFSSLLLLIFHKYFNINVLLVCLFVSNKHQNGWNDPAQISVGPHKTSGKVYEWSKLKKFASNKVWFSENFEKPWNFCIKSVKFFSFCFAMYTKRKLFMIGIEDWREAPSKPSLDIVLKGGEIVYRYSWHCIYDRDVVHFRKKKFFFRKFQIIH